MKRILSGYSHFGRGRHRGRLDFGDCRSYAVSRLAEEALLCTGGDFAQPDLERA